MGVAIRYQDAVLLAIPALDLVVDADPHAARDGGARARAGRRRAVGVLPQLAVNYHLFGNPFTTGYFGEGFLYWRSPWLLYTTVSADVGSGAVGADRRAGGGRPRDRRPARLATRAHGLVVVGLQVYLVSSWYFVSQGHTFGNRMLVNCTVFFAVGLAALLDAAGRRPQLRVTFQPSSGRARWSSSTCC